MYAIELDSVETFAAKVAKNRFGELMERVESNHPVRLTKHDKPAAYLVPPEMFEQLVQLLEASTPSARRLRAEFDLMVAQMQTPENVEVGKSLFDMDDAELRAQFRKPKSAPARKRAQAR